MSEPQTVEQIRECLAALFKAGMPNASRLELRPEQYEEVPHGGGLPITPNGVFLAVAEVLDEQGEPAEPEFWPSKVSMAEVGRLCVKLTEIDGLEPQTIELR